MTDIVDLIQGDHRRIRRLLDSLDSAQRRSSPPPPSLLAPVVRRLAELLDHHGDAEQEICYPVLFGHGPEQDAALQDAIADHGDIRAAVQEAVLLPVASVNWHRAIAAVLRLTREHLDGEERGLLTSFACSAVPEVRHELGWQWARFMAARIQDASAAAGPVSPGPGQPHAGDSAPRPGKALPQPGDGCPSGQHQPGSRA